MSAAAQCQSCGRDDIGCGVVTEAVGGGTQSRWVCRIADTGHTFRFVVTSRMSSKVVGDEHHADSDHFGPALSLDVRAWSLPAALRKALAVPLSEWRHDGDADDD